MSKHRNITKLLKNRIQRGDYQTRPFPSPVKLASELEVDRRTVSKAMMELEGDGLLSKTATGRITLVSNQNDKALHLAMVAPAYSTPTLTNRFVMLEQLATRRGWNVKLVGYTHDYDSVIYEAIDGFDGLFMAPLHDDFPSTVIAKLQASDTKVVALMEDLTKHGIPSLRFENPSGIYQMLDHLYDIGHRSVACLNTQPGGRTIDDRINHWQLWKAIKKVSGPLINEPVEHFQNPMFQARIITNECIEKGLLDVDAIFCTTGHTAIGVMRGLADKGLFPGRDIAVCASDGHGDIAQCLIPSLTCPYENPEEAYWEMCLDWFASDEPQWPGPLLVMPMDYNLFIGESTQPK